MYPVGLLFLYNWTLYGFDECVTSDRLIRTCVRMTELSSCPSGIGYSRTVPLDTSIKRYMNNMFITKLIVW